MARKRTRSKAAKPARRSRGEGWGFGLVEYVRPAVARVGNMAANAAPGSSKRSNHAGKLQPAPQNSK